MTHRLHTVSFFLVVANDSLLAITGQLRRPQNEALLFFIRTIFKLFCAFCVFIQRKFWYSKYLYIDPDESDM